MCTAWSQEFTEPSGDSTCDYCVHSREVRSSSISSDYSLIFFWLVASGRSDKMISFIDRNNSNVWLNKPKNPIQKAQGNGLKALKLYPLHTRVPVPWCSGLPLFSSLPLWALRDGILGCKMVGLTNFLMDSHVLMKCKRGKARTRSLTNFLFFVNS